MIKERTVLSGVDYLNKIIDILMKYDNGNTTVENSLQLIGDVKKSFNSSMIYAAPEAYEHNIDKAKLNAFTILTSQGDKYDPLLNKDLVEFFDKYT